MPQLKIEDLYDALPVTKAEALLQVEQVVDRAIRTGDGIIPFLYAYAAWNSEFGSGVAGLAAKVGRSRHLFTDPEERFPACADRSVLVASYIFAAARDEFDDSETPHLDTHRCLAQALLKGVFLFTNKLHDQLSHLGTIPPKEVGKDDPMWLSALIDRVAVGYGNGSPDNYAGIFRAMGYHLGSELLADKEFSIIDRKLREVHPLLVEHLENTTVRIGNGEHNCYHWVRIHSGDGGGVEMEHFEHAMEGARMALRYADPDIRDDCRHQMILGFQEFYYDHTEFFTQVWA